MMAEKYLHITLPYRYKFEMHGNATVGDESGNGTVKITDSKGNVVFSGTTGGRGHTLFVFDYPDYNDISLIERITYDSAGDIPQKLKSYRTNNEDDNYIFIILSQDSIINSSDFMSELWEGWNFPKNKTIVCSQARQGFAWIGFQVKWYSNNVNYEYTHVRQCDYEFSSVNKSVDLVEYLEPSIVKFGGDIYNNYAKFGRSIDFYTRLCPSKDTSVIGVPYMSLNNNNTTPKSISIKSGYTYKVKVKFRTRGDGTSTSGKCSSLGFICYKPDWSNSFGYTHDSATAYNEIGRIVEWTYTFTPTEDYGMLWAFYAIIENYYGYGTDNQTVDLYQYEFSYVDTNGNRRYVETTDVFLRLSEYFLKTKDSDGNIFYSVLAGTAKRTYIDYHYDYSSKIAFRNKDSDTAYFLCDTLERLSYDDMEKLYYNIRTKSETDITDAYSMKMSNNTLSAYCY